MSDIFEKCGRFFSDTRVVSAADRELAAQMFRAVSPPENAGPWIESNGRKLLQFSTNDYLGLAMHPDVLARTAEVVQRSGICSPMGSRLMTGNTEAHLALEQRLAEFKRTEASITFTSGAMAMIGVLACLAGPRDLLILDEKAHATLVCGAKASGATVRYFRHNDLEHLEDILRRTGDADARALVVDGIYSMDGDMGPLQEVVKLKNRYGVRLLVDDAHGTGVLGENGRGTAAHLGVEKDVDLHLGTFSKAVGTIGGFAAGDATTIEYLRYHAPTYVFSKSMPLAVVAASHVALEILEKADDRRATLWRNTNRLQEGLKKAGLEIANTQTPITPIQLPGNDALYVADELRKSFNIWVSPIVYPAVSLGRSILRVTPTAMHTDEDVDSVIRAVATVRATMALGAIRPA